jgi:hypothetical protein
MRPQIILFGIFALVGAACFLPWLYFTYSSAVKSLNWEEAPATIKTLKPSGYPDITFEYNGRSYEVHENYSSTDMFEGQQVSVYFPTGQPEKAELKSFFTSWFLTLLLGIFWIVFGCIGGIGLWVSTKPLRMRNELIVMGRGRKVSAPIGEVTKDYSFNVNGRSPYIILAHWHDKPSNTVYQFKSEHIWFNPENYLSEKKEIDVFIDPTDFKRYYVDISFLPKKG